MHQPVLDQQIQEISTQNSPGNATFCSNLHYAKQSSAPEIFIMPGGNNKKKIQREDNKLNTSIPQRSSMRVSDFLPLARGSTTITLLLVEPLIVRSPLPEPGEISAPCSLLHQSVKTHN
jgi:hypothetical protein